MTTAPDHITSTAPKRIYLDLGDCAHLIKPDETFKTYAGEVTWSEGNDSGCGIPYMRADLAAPTSPTSGALLTNERIVELWVEHGLDELDPEAFARVIECEVRAALASPQVAPANIDRIIEWIRNNYQDHSIDSLCDGIRSLAAPAPVAPTPLPTDATSADFATWLMGSITGGGITEEAVQKWWHDYCLECESTPAPLQVAPTPAQPSQWQPIETAPKDGSKVLVWAHEHSAPLIVYWGHLNFWTDGYSYEDFTPSFWIPLPSEPEGQSTPSQQGQP